MATIFLRKADTGCFLNPNDVFVEKPQDALAFLSDGEAARYAVRKGLEGVEIFYQFSSGAAIAVPLCQE